VFKLVSDKQQTRPFVREGATHGQESNFQTGRIDTKADRLTDRQFQRDFVFDFDIEFDLLELVR
jgi:hypothetical protein